MNALDRISINAQLDIPLAQQLRQQLLWLIASGELAEGERLPAVHEMAQIPFLLAFIKKMTRDSRLAMSEGGQARVRKK